MGSDDWHATAQSNTGHLAQAVSDLERALDRRDYREFWTGVKSISQAFKELKPTIREQRDELWNRFGDLCARAKTAQDRERNQRQNVSDQKRRVVMSKIDEAHLQARGADSGAGFRTADDLLQQALGWMKDGFSGFGTGTQFFAMNDGKMLKEDHDACWERWREVKDTVRARREEISNYNYGHFKGGAYEARGMAQSLPKEAKDKVRSVQSEMKGRIMERWQFDEIRTILDEAYQRASAVLQERHHEWERKQREWQSRLEDARSKKQSLIEKNSEYLRDLERQVDRCRGMLYDAKSYEHQSRVQGWIDEKTDKIRDIERFNRELEQQIYEIDSKTRG